MRQHPGNVLVDEGRVEGGIGDSRQGKGNGLSAQDPVSNCPQQLVTESATG
ncbi:MAG: hypothetical protein OXL68_09650 [Paracoccaceae bacterium]|nr:hypothetical protein [Paracoccaceae bacterium]